MDPTIGATIPDVPEPIRAYRSWRADGNGTLVGFGVAWPPDRPLRAECRRGRWHAWQRTEILGTGPCDGPPSSTAWGHDGNGCGIYGYRFMSTLLNEIGGAVDRVGAGHLWTSLVVGVVHLWGKVFEHEHGYRAEYAQVVSLLDTTRAFPSRTLREAATRYEVPIVTGSENDDVRLGTWHDDRGGRRAPRTPTLDCGNVLFDADWTAIAKTLSGKEPDESDW